MNLDQETGSENPLTRMLTDALDAYARTLMVCLPGRITGYDSRTQRAQVEFGIRPMVNGQPAEAMIADNVPVQFAGDNQWYHWHQITPGETDGIILFSQRNMEAWKQQGGPATPSDRRTFSGGDAMFIPGVRSAPHAIPNMPASGTGMSNYAGDVSVSLQDGNILATVGSSSIDVSATSVTLIAGGQTFTLDSSGAKHNGTNIGSTHTHPQSPDSSGDSEQDTGTPQ